MAVASEMLARFLPRYEQRVERLDGNRQYQQEKLDEGLMVPSWERSGLRRLSYVAALGGAQVEIERAIWWTSQLLGTCNVDYVFNQNGDVNERDLTIAEIWGISFIDLRECDFVSAKKFHLLETV